MKPLSSREIIKLLTADGWILKGIEGSHHHFTHPNRPGKVTVPHPKKNLKLKTQINILKQAGLA